MNAPTLPAPPTVVYPDSDGQPRADNTLQLEWIITLKDNFDALFADDRTVFVAGDLLWYPVEGEPAIRQAGDVYVVFGRPKGYRGSYQQWLEDNVPPQVLFEVLSPGNRFGEMMRKFRFYERYGVEEYYILDPYHAGLEGYLRKGAQLEEIPNTDGWVSPRLRVRFQHGVGEWQFIRPDGRRFLTFVELERERQQALRQFAAAQQQAVEAQQQAEAAQRQAEEARQRAERLAAQLRALGHDPEP
jgi:Uma2 family endonuclease